MNREIVWTTQFKKDDKLAMKRHMDMDLLDPSSGRCPGRNLAGKEQRP